MTKATSWRLRVGPDLVLDGIMRPRKAAVQQYPVLLIHGSGVGYRCFDLPQPGYSLMESLAERGSDVYAVDQRGYGESVKRDGLDVRANNSALDLALAVSRIQEESGKKQVCLVGHSWGGIVAVLLAAQKPSAVAGLVLIGCPYQRLNEGWAPIAREYARQGRSGQREVQNQHHLTLENKLVAWDPNVLGPYRSMVDQYYPTMPAGVFLDLVDWSFREEVAAVSAPTLLLAGAQESVTDREDLLECFEDLGSRQKELVFIGGCGHLAFLEKQAHRRIHQIIADWVGCLSLPS